jgi:hypothetical protein
MVKEMPITGDKYVTLPDYVCKNMVDIFGLSSFHKRAKVIDHFRVVFRDKKVLRAEVGYIQSKCRTYCFYQRKGLNLVPNRALAFAMPFILSVRYYSGSHSQFNVALFRVTNQLLYVCALGSTFEILKEAVGVKSNS